MDVAVKICGLTDDAGVAAAVEHGAAYVGFVFFPPSPRSMEPARVAEMIDGLPEDVTAVGLFVDPTDADLDAVLREVRLGLIQLHGRESPDRVRDIRLEFGLPVMKAFGVSGPDDLTGAEAYLDVADMFLFDAKPPKEATRPGGNAESFEWSLMKGWCHDVPWLLAGGLTPANVAEAIRVSGAPGVDVSSGVEAAPGRKDPALIAAFLKAVHA